MAAKLADDILNAFSWMKSFVFRFEFHWSCSYGSNWQYASIGSGNGLAPNMRQVNTWSWAKADPALWRIYTALAEDEIMRLSLVRREAIIWTSTGLLWIRPWRTYYHEILVEIQKFSFKKMHLKISSAKWRSFCLSLNALTLGHASHNSFNFLSSDWSSSFRAFADKVRPVRHF